MQPMDIDAVISLLSAAGVVVLGLLQWINQSRVSRADAIDKIGDAYDGLLGRMSEQINELEGRVQYLEKELKKYSNWTARLVKQLIEHGIVPVKPPDTGELDKP